MQGKPDNMSESKFIRKILKTLQNQYNSNTNGIYQKTCKIMFDKMKKYGSNRLKTAINDELDRNFTDKEMESIMEGLK